MQDRITATRGVVHTAGSWRFYLHCNQQTLLTTSVLGLNDVSCHGEFLMWQKSKRDVQPPTWNEPKPPDLTTSQSWHESLNLEVYPGYQFIGDRYEPHMRLSLVYTCMTTPWEITRQAMPSPCLGSWLPNLPDDKRCDSYTSGLLCCDCAEVDTQRLELWVVYLWYNITCYF